MKNEELKIGRMSLTSLSQIAPQGYKENLG